MINSASDTSKSKTNYFLSQPHQPFFLFGVIWAIIDMLIFALAYKGILTLHIWPLEFHSYSLIFIVFTQFFIGFLFTTFPRFCQSNTIAPTSYKRIFYLFQAGALLYLIGALSSGLIASLGKTVLLIALGFSVQQFYHIYKTGTMSHNTSDPFWILTGFWFGLCASFLFWIDTFTGFFGTFAVKTAFNNYLLFVAFAVAQRMVPFFSHVMVAKNPLLIKTVFWLFLLKTAVAAAELTWVEIVIDLLLGIVMLKEFLHWKLPIFNSPSILWVLHLALFWLPAGLILGALGEIAALLTQTHLALMQTHLLAIGFMTTILIGFGTRVTLGHSGQPPNADRFATNLFWFIQVGDY